MKKQILTLAAIALSISVTSQITVTSANVLSVGDLIIQESDTLIAITPSAASPTSQTWDFSTLAQHRADTLRAVDPSTTVYGVNFPTANIALEGSNFNVDGNLFDATIYAKNSTNSFEFVGASVVGTPAEQYDKLIEFPASYDSSFISPRSTYAKASGNDVGFAGADSVELISEGIKTSTFDAFGSLTTPSGTFSVIRQSNQVISHDTINVMYSGSWLYAIQTTIDTTYEHQFWTNDAGVKFPIVTYQLNDQGSYANKSIKWLRVFSFASVGELEKTKLSIFPNPANDLINLNFEGDITSIEVIDISGKRVLNFKVKSRNSLDISKLDNGTYVLYVRSNNSIYTSKFIKR
jgi:hypothetical protein